MKFHYLWIMAARVLPIVALFVLALIHFFPNPTWMQIFWCGVAVISMSAAVTWWWWIMDTVKKFFTIVETQIAKFEEVKEEIKEVKKDLNDVKSSSSRKRSQSKKP